MDKADEKKTPATQAQAANQQPKRQVTAPSETKAGGPSATRTQASDVKTESKRREVKDQRTIVRKRDKALLAALGVFTLVMACVALLGILLIHAPKEMTQGQADCDQVRVSGKLPGRIVKFYVKEGDYVHKGDTLVAISSKLADATLYKAKSAQRAAQAASQKVDKGTRTEIKQSTGHIVEQAKAAEDIAKKTYDRMETCTSRAWSPSNDATRPRLPMTPQAPPCVLRKAMPSWPRTAARPKTNRPPRAWKMWPEAR